MPEQIEFNPHPDPNAYSLKSKQMDLESGWLGRLFGSNKNAPLNIAGFTVVFLLTSGVVVLFVQSAIPAGEYWKIIVPLLTLVTGFIFGKGSDRG